jgi:hypothetical protein
MSERITRKDVESIVTQLEVVAKRLRMMPEDAYLVYSPGSTTKGYSPEVSVFYRQENGRGMVRVSFLPDFTYKTTQTEAYKLLRATLTALYAVPYEL